MREQPFFLDSLCRPHRYHFAPFFCPFIYGDPALPFMTTAAFFQAKFNSLAGQLPSAKPFSCSSVVLSTPLQGLALLHSLCVVNQFINKRAVIAHMLHGTGNMTGFEISTVAKAFTMFAKQVQGHLWLR